MKQNKYKTLETIIRGIYSEGFAKEDNGPESEKEMAISQIKFMRHALDGIENYVKSTPDMEEWFQNKLSKSKESLTGLYSYATGEGDIQEKAVSQQQQKLMGLALAYKRGETKDVSDEVKKIADGMTEKELEDFASTTHKNLPKRK